MDKDLKFPFYAKASLFFIGTFAFLSMLYIGKTILSASHLRIDNSYFTSPGGKPPDTH
jgi:hypothetical protein